jgi:hypothetical protein
MTVAITDTAWARCAGSLMTKPAMVTASRMAGTIAKRAV